YTNTHDPIALPSSMQVPTGIVEKVSVSVPPYNGIAAPSNDTNSRIRFAILCMDGRPSATGLGCRSERFRRVTRGMRMYSAMGVRCATSRPHVRAVLCCAGNQRGVGRQL